MLFTQVLLETIAAVAVVANVIVRFHLINPFGGREVKQTFI